MRLGGEAFVFLLRSGGDEGVCKCFFRGGL